MVGMAKLIGDVQDVVLFCNLPDYLHVVQCVEVYITRSSVCKVPFEPFPLPDT